MQASSFLTRYARPLILGAWLAMTPLAHAMSPSEELLQRMATTMRTVNYEGVLMYAQGDVVRNMRIFHLHDAERGERERLVSLDGPPREVVHEGDRCTCIWPNSRLVVRGWTPSWRGQLSPARFAETSHLSSFYDFSLAETSRVAGIACQVIRIAPRDAYRLGYRLCVHEPSGMLLRLEVMDGDRRLEMNQFVSLRLDPGMGEEALRTSTDLEGFREVDEPIMAASVPFQPRWDATGLPPGYKLALAAERPHPRLGYPLEHLVYTDGLNSLSIFIEPRNERQARAVPPTGAMHRLVRETEQHIMTGIGEAPDAAIRMILDGLRPIPVRERAKP
ncbi:MAG: MucB/RseB C-terminal domain-containing protein [Pseudomonadota bacterium]